MQYKSERERTSEEAMKALAEQASEIGQAMTRAALDTTKPR